MTLRGAVSDGADGRAVTGAGMGPFWSVMVSAVDRPALSAGLGAALRAAPDGLDLGFLYLTDAAAAGVEDLLAVARRTTGVDAWVGSVGAGICATEGRCFGRPAVSVLLGRFGRDRFRVFGPLGGTAARPPDLAGLGAGLGVVHGDPQVAATFRALPDFAKISPARLVGGLSGGAEAPVQIAGAPVSGGLSGVVVAASVPAAIGHSQGCAPLGPEHRITAAQGGTVQTLDGRSALAVLHEDLAAARAACGAARLVDRVHVGLVVPGADRDYLVRGLSARDPARGSFSIADTVAIGDRIVFVHRDPQTAQDDLAQLIDRLQADLPGAARAGLYFSCVARGPHLFPAEDRELAQIRTALGPIPLAGFFANGEICHNRLYGETGVLALFG